MIPGGTITATLGSDVETAAIQSDGSFTVTFDTATLGVQGSPYSVAFAYAGDSTFLGASGSSQLSVTPATLTVTANDASRTYGWSDPAFSDAITGFVNGETLGDSGVTGAPSLTSSDTAASPVGTYAITAGLAPECAELHVRLRQRHAECHAGHPYGHRQ